MKWFWIALFCFVTLSVFAQTVEKKVLLEGESEVIPYTPIENAFVADPEFVSLEISPDQHTILTALKPGITWVYFWYQGNMHQWEIEVRSDPLMQLKQRRAQKKLLERYFNFRNQYQLTVQSQFSEEDTTSPIFLHSLSSAYELRKLRAGFQNTIRIKHQGLGGPDAQRDPRFSIAYIQPVIRTRYAELAYGDFNMQQGTSSGIPTDFTIRGGTLSLHDFLRSGEENDQASLVFFGGGEYTGGEQFGFDFDQGRAFGAKWQHGRFPYHDFNLSTVVFRPRNNRDYSMQLAQGSKFPIGKGYGGESFLFFPDGIASQVSAGQPVFSWLHVNGNYGFVPHQLKSFTAVENLNDIHSYGVGFSERVSPRWHLSQSYGENIIVGRSGIRRKGRSHTGSAGSEWNVHDEAKQYNPHHLSFRYQINYALSQEPQTQSDLDRYTHQGSGLYQQRFSKERAIVYQASYLYDNQLINFPDREGWQSSIHYNFRKDIDPMKAYGTITGWNAGLRASQTLRPTADYTTFATGQSQIAWRSRSLSFVQELGVQDGEDAEFLPRSVSALTFSWTLHPRHWLQMLAQADTRLTPPATGDRIFGTLLLNYYWNLGGGISSTPQKKIRLKKHPKNFSGTVFQDINYNRQKDGGETGVPGVKIQIVDAKEVETDPQGRFKLKGLKQGVYTLKIDLDTIPEGWVLDGLSEHSLVISRIGISPPVLHLPLVKLSPSLAVYVFEDTNADQHFGYEDVGIPNVTLSVQGEGKTLRCQTASSGYCRFSDLLFGTWEVSTDVSEAATHPADIEFLATKQTVKIEGVQEYKIQFLARTLRVLTGEIYLDKDQNGDRDEGDLPLKNVSLRIATNRSASDSQGQFLIRGLKPGSYPIQILGGLPRGTYIPERFLQVTIPPESGVVTIRLPVRKK